MKANRTEILFNIGNKIFKFAIYNLLEALFNDMLNPELNVQPKEYQKDQFEIFKQIINIKKFIIYIFILIPNIKNKTPYYYNICNFY